MKLLYLDCFSGISGDMTLGALLDLGLPFDELRQALGSLMIEGWEIGVERVVRGGIAASKFNVFEPRGSSPAAHAGQAGSHGHGHRTLAEITRLIEQSALSADGRRKAATLFRRLAEVEAGIHQMPVEQVHLHEVGAVDSIVDIVGAVFAFEWLAPDRVVVSPLNVGRGTVRMAHGVLPVPAPATAQLLQGVPIYASGPEMEMVTPTGALIVTAYAQQFGSLPAMRVERIGYGAGDHDPDGQPNVLRAMLGTAEAPVTVERVLVIECEIDDMNPQIFGVVMDRLLAAGALDVYYAPVQMKKNRPATLVTVIARPADRDALAGILFRETTTIGLRYQELDRERLDRESMSVETALGAVRIKIARRGGVVMNAAPEFDDCVRLARERQMPVKDVQAMAMKAYLDHKC
jgi:uncharacterized protein (TIGR00299 family) protein